MLKSLIKALLVLGLCLSPALARAQNVNIHQINPNGWFLPFGADIGATANAYVVNPIPAVTATFGASFTFTTTRANSGATTINASGTGVKNLRTILGVNLSGGEMIDTTGTVTYQATFDGTDWLLAGSLTPGFPVNPAGRLNLAGAFLVGTPNTANSSGGLTFISTPGNSGAFDRNLLNFVWVPSAGGQNLYSAFGFDGDDVFLLTGTMQAFAIEMPTEIFRPFSFFNQGTGDSIIIQQNNTPSAGACAIHLLQPFGIGSAPLWCLTANNGIVVNPLFTIGAGANQLPSAASAGAGATTLVSDSNTFTPGLCTGGGSDTMIAVSNGANWTCH